MNYIVSYDLNAPGKNYQALYNSIERISGGAWCRPLESVWIIRSMQSATEIFNALKPSIDQSDRLLVCGLTGDYAGYLDTKVIDYLKKMM